MRCHRRRRQGEVGCRGGPANLIEALTTGVPHGALWLVPPNAIWEIPSPYLKGPADVSPRPSRRRHFGLEGVTD